MLDLEHVIERVNCFGHRKVQLNGRYAVGVCFTAGAVGTSVDFQRGG